MISPFPVMRIIFIALTVRKGRQAGPSGLRRLALQCGVPQVPERNAKALAIEPSAKARQDPMDCGTKWRIGARAARSEEHTSELQSHRDLHSFPTRRSSDLSARKECESSGN